MTPDLLFVYGTLMRGFDHPMATLLSRAADFIGEARCQGRLYRVKHYPGLVLSEDADDVVFGEAYRLPQPVELLREFDMYEACGEGFAEPTEYVRQMLPVTLGDGEVREAWTYIYNWPVTRLPRIASGRFLEEVATVIPGCASWRRPGIHTPCRGYGFRPTLRVSSDAQLRIGE